jgi:hypothetical protein
LKNGGPRLRLVPVSASDISGKKVPQKISRHSATRTRLFSRKNASRETSESSRPSERSESRREISSAADPSTTSPMKIRNGTPSVEAPKAWIESRIPDRTRNVPISAAANVAITSPTFQTFSIPRFSWTITECTKAVPSSHGISDAFSTASQAQ